MDSTKIIELFVNNEIKQSATLCQNDHVCLTRNKENICKVISTVNNNVMYVICLHKNACNYKHQVDERILCTCPVRLEIFKKFNI